MVASVISESLHLMVPADVVVTILRETANDVVSRCNPTSRVLLLVEGKMLFLQPLHF